MHSENGARGAMGYRVPTAHGKLEGSGGQGEFKYVKPFLGHFQTTEAVSISNYSCMRN